MTTTEIHAWWCLAASLDLPENALGKTFTIEGITYELTGLQVNRPKFPVCVRRVNDGTPSHLALAPVREAIYPSAYDAHLVGRTASYKDDVLLVVAVTPNRLKRVGVVRIHDGEQFDITAHTFKALAEDTTP